MTRQSTGAAKAAAALALISAAALAAADPGSALGIEECVERALASSSATAIGAAKSAASAARLDYARRQYIPSLSFSGSFTHSSEIEPGTISFGPNTIELPESQRDAWLFRLSLQQPLFTGFRIESGIDQAKAALEAARAEERQASRAAASAAERAWWALYMASQAAAVVDEGVAAQKAHVAEARARLESGAALNSELLSARMREADLEAAATEAASALSQARARLNILIGLPWDAPTLIAEPADPDLEAAIGAPSDAARKARAARPELSASAARVSMQEAALASARSSLLPGVFLTGSYSLADPNPKAFPQREGFESLWDIGILVSMELGRVPAVLAQSREARAGIEQARLALSQLEDSIELEAVSACLELAKCADRLRAGASSVELAEEALRSQRDRFVAGLAVESAVSDAENDLLRARLERTRSRVAWELARIALRDAVGE